MYDKYLEFGGTEIVNAQRVARYVELNAPEIQLRKRWMPGTLHLALGEENYESPAVDGAPWVDPSDPYTAQFYGVYPLSVRGGRGSTREAATTQSLGDGGATGAERHASRAIRVRALLVAANKQALEAGQTWLEQALSASTCDDHGGSCGGAKLCYYSAEPPICDEWSPTYEPGYTVQIATNALGSPYLIREPGSSAIFKARLEGSTSPMTTPRDGVILRWGTVDRANTSREVEAYGPVILQRTNLFTRPDFLADDVDDWWGGDEFVVVDDGTGPSGRAFAQVTADTGLVQPDTEPIVAPAGGVVVSMDLRGAVDQEVELELRDPDDNSVLTSASFLIRDTWDRYSVPLPPIGPFYITITSDDDYDLTGITVETGQMELPHLDGGVPWQEAVGGYLTGAWEDEYTVSWLGEPSKSASRLVWNGTMTVGMTLGTDYDSFDGGVCDVWPFIAVQQGEFGGGNADFAVRRKIQPDEQALPFERTMHEVRCTGGPTPVGDDYPLRTAGAMREVEFFLMADKPWAYSATETLIEPTTMSELPTSPWPGTDQCAIDDVVPPLVDPDCIAPPEPPRPPEIVASCVVDEPVLYRYWLSVPAEKVSLWSDMVPRITIRSGAASVRQVRVRAFPNPFERVPNPDALWRWQRVNNGALEVNATDWASLGTGTATGRQTGAGPWAGVNWYRVTATGAHAADAFGAATAATGKNVLSEGEAFRPSVFARSSVARNLKLRYVYYNGAGSVISTNYGAVTAVAANTWTRLTLADSDPLIAPPGTVRIGIGATGHSTAWASTQTLDVGGATVEVADPSAWGHFPLDRWWNADHLAQDGSPAEADTFYYTDMGVGAGDDRAFAVQSAIDPCSWCSEFIVSYLPPNTELTVDAIVERAFAAVGGAAAQAADHLMFATDGGPMTWPALSCGIGYLFAIDVPEPLLDDVTVALEMSRRH